MSTDKRIPILFLHSSADLYGSDRSLFRIVTGLDKKLYRPYVIVPCDGPLVEQLREKGVLTGIMPLGILRRRHMTPWGIPLQLFRAMIATLRLVYFVYRQRITLIQSNTLAVIVGGVVARLTRRPHVWYVREIVTRPKWVKRFLTFLMMRFASKVIAVSEAVKLHWQEVQPKLASKLLVVRNGLPLPKIDSSQESARARLGLPVDGIWVGMAGRINRMKGQGTFLEIAQSLCAHYPEARFLCVGDPPLGEKWRGEQLAKSIARGAMQEKFFLKGFRADMETFYEAMDIVVVPSLAPDSFPTVCLEAGMFGKPVVAFDEGGMAEIVQDGQTGFCVAGGDRDGFLKNLGRLLESRSLRDRLGKQARERCQAQFSLEKQMQQLQDLYQQTLNRVR